MDEANIIIWTLPSRDHDGEALGLFTLAEAAERMNVPAITIRDCLNEHGWIETSRLHAEYDE